MKEISVYFLVFTENVAKHSRLCRYLLYVFDNKAVYGGYVCGKLCPNRAPTVPLGGGAGSSLLHCLPYSASNGAS